MEREWTERLGDESDPDYSPTVNEYSPIVSEFESQEQEKSYLRWLQAKVAKSRADPRPPVPHDEAMARIRRSMAEKLGKPC